jgi:hypothetical protein
MHHRVSSTPWVSASLRRRAGTVSAAGLVTVAALLLSGCGGGSSGAAEDDAAASESASGQNPGHEGHDMNMGDPSATPADEIPEAEVQEGDFTLLDTRPPGMDEVKGTAWLAQHDEGTTVTVSMTGLEGEADYISHLHVRPCSEDGGGPHFKFDEDGSELPPNEVHLAFTSDSAGKAEMTVNNDRRTEDGAVSLVVHPQNALDNRIACVDF